MTTVALILFCIWVAGTVIITNKNSEHTIWSLLELKPPRTTFKGWVYLILWGALMFFLIGLVGLLGN